MDKSNTNKGLAYIELRTTSCIESIGVTCSDSVNHDRVQVLSIPILLEGRVTYRHKRCEYNNKVEKPKWEIYIYIYICVCVSMCVWKHWMPSGGLVRSDWLQREREREKESVISAQFDNDDMYLWV